MLIAKFATVLIVIPPTRYFINSNCLFFLIYNALHTQTTSNIFMLGVSPLIDTRNDRQATDALVSRGNERTKPASLFN